MLAAAGLAAGCLNTLAGGGSLITVPIMLALGLPAGAANATNRLAVLTQSTTGVVAFARARAIDRAGLAPVIATALVGALIGALAATRVPARVLEVVLLSVMVGMAGLLLIKPDAIVAPEGSTPRWTERRGATLGALLATALYGGFVQGGVGFPLVWVLSGLVGYGIGPASALKAVATLCFSAVSLAVFAAHGLVVWQVAIVLAAFTGVGSLIGVRLALTVRPRGMRWVLFVGVLTTSVAALAR